MVCHDRSIVQHHERILLQYFSRLNH
jgi:hypothetical protein